jgi:hypothetical protein
MVGGHVAVGLGLQIGERARYPAPHAGQHEVGVGPAVSDGTCCHFFLAPHGKCITKIASSRCGICARSSYFDSKSRSACG